VRFLLDHLQHLWKATRFSLAGLRAAYAQEKAFQQETWILLILIPLALVLGHTALERALLIASWTLVLIVELLNSALEATIDRIGPERHELSGRAKDLGSAAVFASVVLAAIVWFLVLRGAD